MALKLMWVRWRDSRIFVNAYHDIGEEADYTVTILESVGFLVDSNDDRITLAMDYDGEESRYRQLMSIPAENVVKKRFIPLGSSKRK